MRKRKRLLISTTVLVTLIGAIFFGGVPEVTGQKYDGFVIYEFYVFCDDSGLPSAPAFSYTATEGGTEGRPLAGTHTFCVGHCKKGKPPDQLADGLGEIPAKAAAALQAQVDAYQANATPDKRLTCVGEKPPEKKCESPSRLPSSPWLDPDVPCQKRERGVVSWKHIPKTSDMAFTVKLCDETIDYVLRNSVGRGLYTRSPGVRVFDVCCDSWRNAADSKSPCDVRKDTDCDGWTNEEDRFPDIPEDLRQGSEFFVVKAPTLGGPWRQLHPPDQNECKDCKWELISCEFTSKEVPNRLSSKQWGQPLFDTEYRFKTLWKCPVTGQTKENYEIITVPPIPPVIDDSLHRRG